MQYFLLITTLIGIMLPSPLYACGGFFCANNIPIDQTAEKIVFAVDEESEKITAHVQIQYTGDAHDFSWVVPVPALPELAVGSDRLFDTLTTATRPNFTVDWKIADNCGDVPEEPADDNIFATDVQSAAAESDDSDGVTVIEGKVGPFDTQIIQATTSEALLSFLQNNNYDIPDSSLPLIESYVQGDSYFVGLRLQSDKSTGDIQPLIMTYDSTKAMVPIRLTSIAATPNLGLLIWILGKERAIPDNFQHVHVNYARLNWQTAFLYTSPDKEFQRNLGNANYGALVQQAVDEADNQHAFVTDAAFPITNEFKQQLAAIPFASDFEDDEASAEADATALDVLDDYTYITRFFTTLDPDEMTLDPTFLFNPDLPDVPNERNAKGELFCSSDGFSSYARIEMEGQDPFILELEKTGSPAFGAPVTNTPFSGQIEQLQTSGAPDVLQSNGRAIQHALMTEERFPFSNTKSLSPTSNLEGNERWVAVDQMNVLVQKGLLIPDAERVASEVRINEEVVLGVLHSKYAFEGNLTTNLSSAPGISLRFYQATQNADSTWRYQQLTSLNNVSLKANDVLVITGIHESQVDLPSVIGSIFPLMGNFMSGSDSPNHWLWLALSFWGIAFVLYHLKSSRWFVMGLVVSGIMVSCGLFEDDDSNSKNIPDRQATLSVDADGTFQSTDMNESKTVSIAFPAITFKFIGE